MSSYVARRGEVREYFDRTALAAWVALSSDAPVSPIRATVRAGRDRMAAALLGRLPERLDGVRILDAGCGAGTLCRAMGERGASVVGVDVSPALVELGRERVAGVPALAGRVQLEVGDMRDPSLGTFDYVIAMDSLIHYQLADAVETLAVLAMRARRGVLFTFAPRTPLLSAMHAMGQLLPRGDRSPDIVPVGERALREALGADPRTAELEIPWTERIASGFYTSQAMELART